MSRIGIKYSAEIILTPLRTVFSCVVQLSHRKSRKWFNKYAAPILHLSGIDVTIVDVSVVHSYARIPLLNSVFIFYYQSEYEGQIRTLMNYVDPKIDGIVVAGGDGTILEVKSPSSPPSFLSLLPSLCSSLLLLPFSPSFLPQVLLSQFAIIISGYQWNQEEKRLRKCFVVYLCNFNKLDTCF